jgi:hypothetical protein
VEPRGVAVEAVNMVSARFIIVRDVERGLEGGAERGVASSDFDTTANVTEGTPFPTFGGRAFIFF